MLHEWHRLTEASSGPGGNVEWSMLWPLGARPLKLTLGRNERRGAKLTGSRIALWAIIFLFPIHLFVLFRALPGSPRVG